MLNITFQLSQKEPIKALPFPWMRPGSLLRHYPHRGVTNQLPWAEIVKTRSGMSLAEVMASNNLDNSCRLSLHYVVLSTNEKLTERTESWEYVRGGMTYASGWKHSHLERYEPFRLSAWMNERYLCIMKHSHAIWLPTTCHWRDGSISLSLAKS